MPDLSDIKKGRDYTGVTVVFFCHDGKGNYLMAKRSHNARDEQGKWDVGGGGVEFGDEVEERLKKEILEEYCAETERFEFLGYRDVHRQSGGNPTHWISLDFKVLVNPLQVRIGEPQKFDRLEWFSLDELPPDQELHSQLRFALNKYKDLL